MNKSTAHRLLSQMEAIGFIQRYGSRRYRIGQSLMELAMLAHEPLELGVATYPAMSTLALETGETVNLAVLDLTEIVVVNVIESRHEFRWAAKVGRRRPFYVTASGKVMAALLSEDKLESLLLQLQMPLAAPTANSIKDLLTLRKELNLVRTSRFAIDNEEGVQGVRAVAAPVFNGKGEAEGAISVAGPTSRITEERIATIAPQLLKAADSATVRLGGNPDVFGFMAEQQKRLLTPNSSDLLSELGAM